jgi:hypothetical protein
VLLALEYLHVLCFVYRELHCVGTHEYLTPQLVSESRNNNSVDRAGKGAGVREHAIEGLRQGHDAE